MVKVAWKPDPDPQDYPAAASYLSLLLDDQAVVERLVAELTDCELVHYKAKDILRAARLPLLPASDPHVASDLRKIRKGKALSPVLLVRGDLLRGFPLQIVDGYHRVCASYRTAETTDIPCRVIQVPTSVPTRAAKTSSAPARRTRAATNRDG